VNLQVGVDARLNRVKLVIEGVRAKVLLKVWLDEVRAILEKALDTLGEHPEILENLIKAINELLQGRLGDALGALTGILEGLEEGDTVDALLKGRLEDVRATLEQILEQVGVDEGESRLPIGEGPTDTTGEPTQEER
jgi:class 3 adenylate cyclase